MIRVLVAENSRIHSRLLADALKSDSLLEVTPFESDSSDLVATVVAEDVDVLVLSSTLDEHPSKGFEILTELRSLHRDTRSILLLGSYQGRSRSKGLSRGCERAIQQERSAGVVERVRSQRLPGKDLGERSRSGVGRRGSREFALGPCFEREWNEVALQARNSSSSQPGGGFDQPRDRRATQTQSAHDQELSVQDF